MSDSKLHASRRLAGNPSRSDVTFILVPRPVTSRKAHQTETTPLFFLRARIPHVGVRPSLDTRFTSTHIEQTGEAFFTAAVMFFSNSVSFDPKKDIPSLENKVILVTGGTNGLGKQSVLEYARHQPAEIWLAARNLEKAQAAADEVKKSVPGAQIKLLELDLASLESVKTAAKKFTEECNRLDILALNAGIMATPPGLTKEHYEVQFGTNHMGHALLTKLLIPVLDKTAKLPNTDVRIVALSSKGHNWVPGGGLVFDSLKTDASTMGPYLRYGQSKLSNLLFIRQMAKEHPQLTSVAVHPGLVHTNLAAGATGSPWIVRSLTGLSRYVLSTVEDGVKNQLWASVAKDVKSGEYYEPVGVGGTTSALGKSDELAKKLWDWTEKELEKHGA